MCAQLELQLTQRNNKLYRDMKLRENLTEELESELREATDRRDQTQTLDTPISTLQQDITELDAEHKVS